MLESYNNPVSSIICMFAHSGKDEDDGNRIYEIAAAVLSPTGLGEPVSSPVRYAKTTERDWRLSGVSRDVLQHAPTLADVSAFLSPLFRETDIVVALSPQEEMENLLAACGNPRFVDLRFAAEFLLPQANTASLKSIWEYLYGKKRDKYSFSAEEALRLSVDLLKHLSGFILNTSEFPPAAALRFYLRKSNTLLGDLLIALNRHFRGYFGELFDPAGGEETPEWKGFLEKIPPKSPIKHPEEKRKISLPHLEEIFLALSAKTKGYAVRPTQIEYAKHVAGALNEREVLTIEAGTGTGKTQGYLIPVLEFLSRNPGARVAISTYTKNLQEQIIRREIPLAVSLKPDFQKIPVAILKGKSNYLCAEKLDNIFEESLTGGRLLLWLYYVNKIFYFRQVDGDVMGERIRYFLNDGFFFRRLQHEASARSGCTRRHARCPAQIVAAEALNSRLVVTNHHKLALLNKDGPFTGIFENCVIDEANHFEQAIRSAFAMEVSSRELSDSAAYIETALQRMARRLDDSAGQVVFEAIESINDLREEMTAFSMALSSTRGAARSGEAAIIPNEHPAFDDGRLSRNLLNLRKILKKIAACLAFIKDPDTCAKMDIHNRTAERIRTALQDLEENADILKAISDMCVLPAYVTSAVLYVHHWSVTTRAVEVADILRSSFYRIWDSVVFTSATLRQGKSFDGFRSITGLTEKNDERILRFEAIPSAFQSAAFEISVPANVISGAYEGKESWLASVAELLPALVRENRGRTLVLFVSYEDLNKTAARVGDDIRAAGYPLLLQEYGLPTTSLVDEFREIRESVLFGVDSFWFGVDFPGDTLTQVIITRLPFPHPQAPLQIARRAILPEKEYWKRYRYEMAIKLRQGIGRLIRSEADHGRVVILDSRYRKYGRQQFETEVTLCPLSPETL